MTFPTPPLFFHPPMACSEIAVLIVGLRTDLGKHLNSRKKGENPGKGHFVFCAKLWYANSGMHRTLVQKRSEDLSERPIL